MLNTHELQKKYLRNCTGKNDLISSTKFMQRKINEDTLAKCNLRMLLGF